MKPFLLSLALVATGVVAVQAQPSATMRPSLLASWAGSASYSSKEDLTYQDVRLGEVAVSHFAFSVSGRHVLAEDRSVVYGLAYTSHELDSTGVLLPTRLAELSVNLGWQQQLSPEWSLGVYLRPGFYGDFESLDAKSLNLPVLALGNYRQSETLTWSVGLTTNPFSDNPVIPIAGVRWAFAQGWVFSVGFPRSGFTWQFSDTLQLRTGVGFEGGSFRVTDNLGVPKAGVPRLANTFVDYREVQVGVGADLTLSSTLSASFDAGAITDRKFDYFDRDYRLDGDAGYYVTLALKARF